MNSFVAEVGYSRLEILITCLPIRHSLSKQTRSDFVITGMLLERFSENKRDVEEATRNWFLCR